MEKWRYFLAKKYKVGGTTYIEVDNLRPDTIKEHECASDLEEEEYKLSTLMLSKDGLKEVFVLHPDEVDWGKVDFELDD